MITYARCNKYIRWQSLPHNRKKWIKSDNLTVTNDPILNVASERSHIFIFFVSMGGSTRDDSSLCSACLPFAVTDTVSHPRLNLTVTVWLSINSSYVWFIFYTTFQKPQKLYSLSSLSSAHWLLFAVSQVKSRGDCQLLSTIGDAPLRMPNKDLQWRHNGTSGKRRCAENQWWQWKVCIVDTLQEHRGVCKDTPLTHEWTLKAHQLCTSLYLHIHTYTQSDTSV